MHFQDVPKLQPEVLNLSHNVFKVQQSGNALHRTTNQFKKYIMVDVIHKLLRINLANCLKHCCNIFVFLMTPCCVCTLTFNVPKNRLLILKTKLRLSVGVYTVLTRVLDRQEVFRSKVRNITRVV